MRGALGTVADRRHPLYARFFEASAAAPFVLRARDLDRRTFVEGETFTFGVNLFLTEGADYLVDTVRHWEHAGLGRERSRVELLDVSGRGALHLPVVADVEGGEHMLSVHFVTPTELKDEGTVAQTVEFGTLYSRLRDRVSRLSALYGDGPLPRDEGFDMLARSVRIAAQELRHVNVTRQSSRTGQRHPLGGLLGTVVYNGLLSPFLPLLEVGQWTGVGRQTSWGKGELCLHRA